jgi:hypothetical protein
MVYTSATLIFITSVITLYALILHRKNLIILIFLIPMLLTSTVYTGYSIYALQGTPIQGLPLSKAVEILWVEPAKPWIRLMLRVGDESEPTYYKIVYTEKNMEEINKAMAKAKAEGKDGIEGQFELKGAGGEERGGEYVFMQKPRSINPGKKTRSGNDDNTDYSLPQRPNGPSIDQEVQERQNEELQRELDAVGMSSGHSTSPIREPLTEDNTWCDSDWGCGP